MKYIYRTGKNILVKQRKKPLFWKASYDRENNDYTNALRPRCFKWCDFSTNFIHCSTCSTLFTCQVFPKYYLNKFGASIDRKILLGPMKNARDQHDYRHKLGKIGPSQILLSKHGDLSFLLCVSKLGLVENIQGKFQKNSSVALISEESPSQYNRVIFTVAHRGHRFHKEKTLQLKKIPCKHK